MKKKVLARIDRFVSVQQGVGIEETPAEALFFLTEVNASVTFGEREWRVFFHESLRCCVARDMA